ncbi:MAG TPA: competence/damage-inducible protein A [Bacteroidales bacterium]|nr:competence/damage-inducible protein A [Bacteroidales bacterium]
MNAEIITIGDEILIGQTVDTNSAWMANKLNLIGIDIIRITSISDKKEEIFKALDNAKQLADIVLITGGLGPTDDDITKKALAEYFNTKLVQNKEVLNHVEQFVIKRKAFMNERNIRQADVPETCKVVQNKIGTAPGMWFEQDNCIFISMPGVPFEMKEMMNNSILPELTKKKSDIHIIHKVILTQGWPESKLAEFLEDWEAALPEAISLAYLPSPGLIKLRLTAKGKDQSYLEEIISEQVQKLEKLIPDLICGFDSEKIEEVLGKLLIKYNQTLSVAESCTGGNIAHLITSIPGSSEYFSGGVVTYSNKSKENILSVNKSKIDHYGAVSKEVVEEMAEGVRNLFHTDFAIATSGIAGPSGGTEEKPVGTTWIAVSNGKRVFSKKFVFGDHRGRNIQSASLTALNMLQKLILGKEM